MVDRNIQLLSDIVARLATGDMEFACQLQQQLVRGNTWHSLALACGGVNVTFDPNNFPIEPDPTSDGVKLVSMSGVNGFATFSSSQSKSSLVGPGSALVYIAEHGASIPRRVVVSGCVLRRDGYVYVAVYDKVSHAIVLEDVHDLVETDAVLVR